MKVKSLWRGLVLALLLPASTVWALELNKNVPEVYIVKKGDTLWDISGMYLQKPWLWPELWDINPQINNPHLIYPGDELHLVWVNGKPRLRRKGGTLRLQPGMRITSLDLAIPAVSLKEIGPFLRRHRVLDTQELGNAGYVVAGSQGRLISAPGDRLFGRGEFPAGERAYGVYRQNDIYRDPITDELLGYQAKEIGGANLLSSNRDDVVELEVVRVNEEVRINDRLLPMEEKVLDASFKPRAPVNEIENGYMIAVDGGVSQIGSGNIVVLNKGARDGIEIGYVLATYQTGELVFDSVANENVRLPDVRAGLLLVFEVAERVSYGLILKANRPLKVMDKVRRP